MSFLVPLPYEYWQEAIPLVRDTDMDDISFVVLSEYLDAQLWAVRKFDWKAEVKESDRKVYKLTIKDNPDIIQKDGTHKRTRRR
jgi:predicted nucleic acid-binding protein